MNTAVDDNRIKRNPCRIKGADKEYSAERPTASVKQVYDLAEAMPERYRALILAGALTSLRWSELIGLRRCDVDLDRRIVRVTRRLAQVRRGPLVPGRTKSEAGVRTVAIPAVLVPELRKHSATFVPAEAGALVFAGPKRAALRRSNWRSSVKCPDALATAGLPEHFHFHDLRHTGNQMAAEAGATTRELMRRMGHSSVRAAMIYLHATDQRDRAIADVMNSQIRRDHARGKKAAKRTKGAAGERDV
jgi:integrase